MAKNKNNGKIIAPVKEESRPKKEMSEIELLSIVDNAINNSLGKMDTKLANDRLQAMKYYLGDKTGNLAPPEAEGRSSVVSTDLADTIEWILPSLIRIFVSGENSIEFSPKKEGDIQAAQQATDWANHVFYTQNEGFIIIHDWFKDALLQKLGVIKTWWDDSQDITTEEYEGLSLEELTIMMQDGTVEVIQQTPNESSLHSTSALVPPELTYDVKVKRTKDSSHICIENVPPEEFLMNRKARSANRIFDCHHRVLRTVTELKEAGYKNTDSLMNDDNGAEFSQESIERESDTNEFVYGSQFVQSADPAMRFVWITESYMQVDWNGDGLAEWRKIVKSGKTLLSNDEIDEHPFSMLTPIKMPHKLVGRSIADLLMDLQDIKTALLRQFIDNMYLQNNPRQYVDTTKGVNIDDLLDSRVGGIVRGKGENGVTPLAVAPLSPYTFDLLGYIDNVKSDRSGVNDTSKGLDSETLNDSTNNNRNQLVSAAQAKIELIARIFAETGVKDLFKKILKLSSQYQKEAQVVRLTGNKFIPIDPRAWKTQYDVSINVGLGNGNKDQVAGHIMNIMNIQEKALAGGLPIVSAKQIYNAASKLVVNSGFKSADSFFVDPDSQEGQTLAQQQARKPNPEMMKMQAEQQQKQTEFQQKLQLQQQEAAAQKENDDREFAREQADAQKQFNLKVAEMRESFKFKILEMQEKNSLELQKHGMSVEAQSKPTTTIQLDSQGVLDHVGNALASSADNLSQMAHSATHRDNAHIEASHNTNAAILQTLQHLVAAHAQPKKVSVTRNKDGSLVGNVG